MTQHEISHKTKGRGRLALVVVALLGFLLALVAGTIWLWRSISGSDSDVLVAVVAASASVMVSALGIVLGRHNERKKEIEQRRQEKRIPVYETFIDFWFTRVLYAERLGRQRPNTKELSEFYATFTRDVMVWGSDEVILKWGEVRRRWAEWDDPAAEKGTAAPQMLGFESLLLAIRRDIGYPETSLPQGSILGLFLDDTDSLLAGKSPASKDQGVPPAARRAHVRPAGAPAKAPRRGRGRTRTDQSA